MKYKITLNNQTIHNAKTYNEAKKKAFEVRDNPKRYGWGCVEIKDVG